ncbi:hypothetical protein BEP19_04670 [Ammoniphilus oxalaticus]|uniref:Uncharacterized protein n=1 Tax=Ammoniphilus oxalaticus TaxID=66863 RepID=A0A419SM22_9BACL|nr:hypothetical protein [Ammoniphilus oxalaticus]RKD25117.1 hypothetical protein BEP19_04670 [Ammoniphilus oxalaticus]
MAYNKVLPRRKIPFASVHHLLTAHGFRKSGSEDYPIYQAKLQDASTQTEYRIHIPIQLDSQSQYVKLGKVFMNDVELIPSSILNAIYCKLKEIADYLYKARVTA